MTRAGVQGSGCGSAASGSASATESAALDFSESISGDSGSVIC